MNEPDLHQNRDHAPLRSARLLRPFGGPLAAVVGLLCLLTFADMAQPYFLKLLIDDVFVGEKGAAGNWHLLWLILPGMGLVYLLRNLLFYTSRMMALRISEDLCFDLRKRLFEHLQQLNLSFYKSNQPGRISSRLMDDTFKIQSFIQDKLPILLRYVLEFQVLLVIIYLVNWRLALASTIVLPLHFWVYRRFRTPIRRSHSEAQETIANAHGNVIEQFLGMEVVKGFSAEDRESRSFREAIDASRQSAIRTHRFHFAQKVAADLIVGFGLVLLLGYGAWEVLNGRMTGGAFLMFFMYVKMLYPAVLEVISGAGHLSKATASVDRVFEMLDEPVQERLHSDGLVELGELESRLEFRGVRFAYGAGPDILHDVNLVIEPGEHVAISGPSGSGKSTLMSLLPRFNEPTTGQVRIGDRPVNSIAVRSLRGMFGIVFQEIFLFNASVYENLRYARPDATLEEMIECCRITGAHEVIQRLPDGYYTKLGSRGGELSRGEKQRITLARALVRNPRVLILDESTASIDSEASRAILADILDRMRDRTVIMVTHEPDLLDLFERQIRIDDGRIAFDSGRAESEARPRRDRARSVPVRHSTFCTGVSDEFPREVDDACASTGGFRALPPSGLNALLLAGLVALSALAGCVRSTATQQSVLLEKPQVSGGVVLGVETEPDRLAEMRQALDAMTREFDEQDPLLKVLAQSADASGDITDGGLDLIAREAAEVALHDSQPVALGITPPIQLGLIEAAGMLAMPRIAPDCAILIALPKASSTELNEMIEGLALRLAAEHGYVEAGSAVADALPVPPPGVRDGMLLARRDEGGTRVLRFGFRQFVSQPAQLWVFGAITNDGESLERNPDLDIVEPAIQTMIAAIDVMRTALTVRDLETKMIQLSYVNATTATTMLKSMGIQAFDKPADVPTDADFAALPYVVAVPEPAREEIGLIGAGESRSGEFGVSLTPSIASDLSPNTVASPLTQLLVMFHPAHPSQFSRVRTLLDDYIDRPARQIFVEGMVLEISEDGLRDLGIEWELNEGPIFFRFGSPRADGQTDTLNFESSDLDFHRVFTRDFQWDWAVKLRALLREGKAEILSRPSVLTLNNRQSTIRVGEDIPIATSQEGTSAGSNKIAFNFKYLPTGILLNIRPRINESGTEVSMLIDTIVSAVVPGEDLEIRSEDGALLASAPTVSTRRVQTYGRIRNNTPFIIGGLVSREHTTRQDKVPLLGDLPWVGALFRAERVDSLKREVIIVLTPYVLPEDPQGNNIARNLPKDTATFDSFGNELFRSSYRIHTEDVFDLSFLIENRRLKRSRELAEQAMRRNFRLAETEPFRDFRNNRLPGENILVTRMIYEVVKRLEIGKKVPTPRIIFFAGQNIGGYEVRFIERTLAQLGRGTRPEAFLDHPGGKALALTYRYDRDSLAPGRLASEPIPQIALVDCPDRDAWEKLLWELNQPDDEGRQRYTILLQNSFDLERLRRALALKRIVTLNGGDEQLTLSNFSVGKMLLMPELKPDQVHVMDAEVARYFFHTELYYAATISTIEEKLRNLDLALSDPEIRALLDESAGR